MFTFNQKRNTDKASGWIMRWESKTRSQDVPAAEAEGGSSPSRLDVTRPAGCGMAGTRLAHATGLRLFASCSSAKAAFVSTNKRRGARSFLELHLISTAPLFYTLRLIARRLP